LAYDWQYQGRRGGQGNARASARPGLSIRSGIQSDLNLAD
jgi:hypothetical protein